MLINALDLVYPFWNH